MQKIKLYYFTFDILLPKQLSFLSSQALLRVRVDVELRKFGKGVFTFIENLQIKYGDEERGCCVLRYREHREYYTCC